MLQFVISTCQTLSSLKCVLVYACMGEAVYVYVPVCVSTGVSVYV